jgi:hypothetical protein
MIQHQCNTCCAEVEELSSEYPDENLLKCIHIAGAIKDPIVGSARVETAGGKQRLSKTRKQDVK